jgi:hypothetical protein
MFYSFFASKIYRPCNHSLQSFGYGFSVASELGSAGVFAVDRIEDAFTQDDEVDGILMLQFEEGLGITLLVINGVFKVSSLNVLLEPLLTCVGTKICCNNYNLFREDLMKKSATDKYRHL